MAKPHNTISIFSYRDYRKFLLDWYQQAKGTRAAFSFRTFSKRAGFTSSNIFKLVMDGDRNLTAESIEKFAGGLNLNKQEREFFHHLVLFNQAESHKEKDQHFRALLKTRKLKELKPIDQAQYDYYTTWYHTVVRELVVAKDFDGTAEWISQRLYPSVSPEQVTKSIQLLEDLALIEKAPDGQWRQVSSLASTGPEVRSLSVFNYHLNLLELSKFILDKLPAEKRDISALTLGVSKKRLPELKEKIQEFRQEVLKMIATNEATEDVVQINIQMFPLTVEPRKSQS